MLMFNSPLQTLNEQKFTSAKLMEEIKLKWKKKKEEGIFLSDKEDSRFADGILVFQPVDSCWTNAKIETALGASSYVNSP